VLHIDLRAENGDVSAAEEIQSGIELRMMRIIFGSMVFSNQLCRNRCLALGWPEGHLEKLRIAPMQAAGKSELARLLTLRDP